MIDTFSRGVLNRRPDIRFVGPRSIDTIPEPSPADLRPPDLIQPFACPFSGIPFRF